MIGSRAERRPSAGGLAAVALVACVLAAGPGAARAQGLEFPVKAAFLTKFGAFVAWPPGAVGPGEPLRVCVVGDDPFGTLLEQTAAGAPAGAHPLVVRKLAVVERTSACDVIYAGGSARQSTAQALAAVKGQPVLTVTDQALGATRGMIHFVVFEDRVRFHIDAQQAAQGGLGISSKLLAIGLSVKR